jgi:hypothetical protein
MQFEHSFQDVLLAHLRAFRIDDRVVRGGRFRQAGEHGGFGERDVLQVLAEIDPRGARESIGALSQINLVHVDLENLVFRQRALDLVGEQHFVDLAGVGLFARQEEISRDLHGDRAGTLGRVAVRQRHRAGAKDTGQVDTAVIVETRVFNGEYRLLEVIRHVLNTHDAAPFFAEFADQHVICRVDPQRHFRAIVGERFERRQIRLGDHQRVTEHEPGTDNQPDNTN